MYVPNLLFIKKKKQILGVTVQVAAYPISWYRTVWASVRSFALAQTKEAALGKGRPRYLGFAPRMALS